MLYALIIYIIGLVVTGYITAIVVMKENGKEEADMDTTMMAIFFGMCWPIFAPFLLLAWTLKNSINRILRAYREE